jgi:CRISPR/Cas system-associated endonuclease/helicase Cas3
MLVGFAHRQSVLGGQRYVQGLSKQWGYAMRVYHGSDTLVSVIDLQKCKPNRDFGRGFYVTKLRSQAESMAKRVTKYSKKPPVVTEYEFDEYAYQDNDLNVLRFDAYNEEWLDFVVLNRNADKRRQAHEYDIVEGNVADDKITRNITKYLKGKILKQNFLEMLKHSEPNHQKRINYSVTYIKRCPLNSLIL